MNDSVLWFSYKQEKFKETIGLFGKKLTWTDEKRTWNWDNCRITAVKLENNNIHVVLRRIKKIKSKKNYNKNIDIQIKLMIGFDAATFTDIQEEEYPEPPKSNKNLSHNEKKKIRRVIHFTTINNDRIGHPLTDCCIWQWKDIQEEKTLYSIDDVFKKLTDVSNSTINKTKIFDVITNDKNSIVPVVYQPRIDTWRYFLRQVHCYYKKPGEVEVTLVFNDEHLTKFFLFDIPYRIVRFLKYGRIRDVESFKILLKDKIPKKFTFPNIYSDEYTIEKDNAHGDPKPDSNNKYPSHKIKYYYAKENHPVVFVNTANHALAEGDFNHELWKWEYVTWEEFTPIYFGNLDRKELDGLTGIESITNNH